MSVGVLHSLWKKTSPLHIFDKFIGKCCQGGNSFANVCLQISQLFVSKQPAKVRPSVWDYSEEKMTKKIGLIRKFSMLFGILEYMNEQVSYLCELDCNLLMKLKAGWDYHLLIVAFHAAIRKFAHPSKPKWSWTHLFLSLHAAKRCIKITQCMFWYFIHVQLKPYKMSAPLNNGSSKYFSGYWWMERQQPSKPQRQFSTHTIRGVEQLMQLLYA